MLVVPWGDMFKEHLKLWAWDPTFPAQDMSDSLGFCLVKKVVSFLTFSKADYDSTQSTVSELKSWSNLWALLIECIHFMISGKYLQRFLLLPANDLSCPAAQQPSKPAAQQPIILMFHTKYP